VELQRRTTTATGRIRGGKRRNGKGSTRRFMYGNDLLLGRLPPSDASSPTAATFGEEAPVGSTGSLASVRVATALASSGEASGVVGWRGECSIEGVNGWRLWQRQARFRRCSRFRQAIFSMGRCMGEREWCPWWRFGGAAYIGDEHRLVSARPSWWPQHGSGAGALGQMPVGDQRLQRDARERGSELALWLGVRRRRGCSGRQ
jgi:hypothetical protein